MKSNGIWHRGESQRKYGAMKKAGMSGEKVTKKIYL